MMPRMRARHRRLPLLLAPALVLGGGLTRVATAAADSPPGPPAATAPARPAPSPSPGAGARAATPGRPVVVPPGDTPAPRAPYPLPARAAYPSPCPPPKRRITEGPTPRAPHPVVPDRAVPPPVRVAVRTPALAAVSGTGVWVTVFKGGSVDAPAIVRQAAAARMTSIWVRSGSTHDGSYAASVLSRLVPLAHARGMRVIAWDFPTLSDPVADAARLAQTARLSFAGQRVDGVAADIEAKTEGVFLSAARVRAYLSRVQVGMRLTPTDARPLVVTTYRPSDYWWTGAGHYPYRSEAPYVDAFAPQVYWSCLEPGAPTAQAVDRLRTLGKAVDVVGQAYDMGPAGGRPGTPRGDEVWRFLDVAKRHGASGASLYLYSQMTPAMWRAATAYPWKR